jgi:hypothetical protein
VSSLSKGVSLLDRGGRDRRFVLRSSEVLHPLVAPARESLQKFLWEGERRKMDFGFWIIQTMKVELLTSSFKLEQHANPKSEI